MGWGCDMGELKTFKNMPAERAQLSRIAGQVHDYSQVQINTEAVQNVNEIFRELAATCPAWRSAYPDAESLNSAKQVWAKGLIENGVTSMGLIRCGLREARSRDLPFVPSVGTFVTWCKAKSAELMGLPTVDDVMYEFERYNARHYDYQNPESFPWVSPVMYWIVLDMRRSMYQYNKTAGEMRKVAEQCLIGWEKKLRAGESVPAPVAQIANKSRPISVSQQMDRDGRYKNAGMALLERIRAGRATA